MKKIISALLSIVIAFSFVACSKNVQSAKMPDELVDSWSVAGIYYKDKLISLDDSAELKDLYDSKWLTINDDSSFCYMGFVNYNGVLQSTNEENTYILKTENITRYESENGHLKEVEDTKNEVKNFVITILSDETDTILFNDYDGSNLHPDNSESTFVFTKGGTATNYINENKAVINGSSDTQTTTSGYTNYGTYTTQPSYVTSGERNALEKAYDYLDHMAFSYTGLIKQLEYEGFTKSEAEYAVDNCGADWNEQAYKKAVEYLNYSAFSRSELISQLKYEGFTDSQAEYGVSLAY